MDTEVISTHAKPRARQLLLLLAMLATLSAVAVLNINSVLALPGDDDYDPLDLPGDPEVTPSPDGFSWAMRPRFGPDRNGDGLVDSHWDPASATYDPTYVHPTEFLVDFDGCRTVEDLAGDPNTMKHTYQWTIDGTVVGDNVCQISRSLTAGSHTVVLAVTENATNTAVQGSPFAQEVLIRDILIVSIGDSFASGEGNPDKRATWSGWPIEFLDTEATWQDKRCHRSAYAGPAQAAMAIERADPHTSVTFLSFACSGATIYTGGYDKTFNAPDYAKYTGTGVLGEYRGVEPPAGVEYNRDQYLPSQIAQLRSAVADRPIDALLVSAGGNDAQFGLVAETCVLSSECWNDDTWVYDTLTWAGQYRLRDFVARAIARLPDLYADLANELALIKNVTKVYLTEYPDLTRGDDGSHCKQMLEDIQWPLEITLSEAQWADGYVLTGINEKLHAAATTHSWRLVSGIRDEFRSDSQKQRGHGYCATDNWVRRAEESAVVQGPNKADTKGTLHPNIRGHQAYKEALVSALMPDLGLGQPNAVPTFSVATTDGSCATVPGTNGWMVGSSCDPSKVVLKVTTTDSDTIDAAGEFINDVSGCATSGVACTTALSTDRTSHTWLFGNVTREGIHRLRFTAQDGEAQAAEFVYELKVDLQNPTATATIPANTPTTGSWYTTAVNVTLTGTDSEGGSGVSAIAYQLNGGAEVQVVPGSDLTLTDGRHTLTYQAVDAAGRRSAAQTLTVPIDTAPPQVQCAAADGDWHADDVSLACTASDGGAGLANSNDASLVLSTDVAIGTETANASTNSRPVCDGAGHCTTAGSITGNKIDKKAPSIAVTLSATGPYQLNQAVSITYRCTDSGSGVAACAGPLPSGALLDTTSVGAKSFTTRATDNAGNAASEITTYQVSYNICVLYDQTKAHRSGSTVPIKLQLCDSTGANTSAPGITVKATGLKQIDSSAASEVVSSGNANPDSNFRYDEVLAGYIYNLSTSGLTTGTWELSFTATDDPVPHTVRFDIK